MSRSDDFNANESKIYNFKLETQSEDIIHKQDTRQFSFYQICQFPIEKRYAIRKLIYNEDGELQRYSEKKLKKDLLDKFLKGCPPYKLTLYSAYELDTIGFPNAGDILMARSQILNEY